MTKQKRVLVLGAYGLIGTEVAHALRERGHEVTGLVRSKRKAARLLPGVPAIEADIARLESADEWRDLVAGFDAVVNASGALQDGLRDHVAAVQDTAIRALISACEKAGVSGFVQISAPGAEEGASTEFMRSKARADAFLRGSGLNWTILKPGLVIVRTAYGGTALIRMLAAIPWLQPLALPDARLQVVSAVEIGEAVADCLEGGAHARRDYDLVSEEAFRLAEIVAQHRRWLGFAPARAQFTVPGFFGSLAARLGDLAGWFGWRPALRTTALKVLEKDVIGDPAPWASATGRRVKPLESILASMPAASQERLYARVQLLLPVLILTLSIFFISSGLIGLWRLDAAIANLSAVVGDRLSRLMVIGGAVLDMALGAAILLRPLARGAAFGMVLLSAAYLVLGTWLTPSLWGDPLGPLVKIPPVMVLALAAAMLSGER